VNKKIRKSNPDGKSSMYIGMDLHKNYLPVAVIDKDGNLLCNSKINNDKESIDGFLDCMDRNAKVVMESSSVWYDTYCRMEEKGFDAILSNPVKTKATASAKIKTDKNRCQNTGRAAQKQHDTAMPHTAKKDNGVTRDRKA
jgi:transposase